MRKLKVLIVTAMMALIAACSGSDNTLVVDPMVAANNNLPPPPVISSLTLLTSAASVGSDGTESATITALVRDASNNVMEAIPISFSADSGSLIVTQPATTDANGTLIALLGPGGDLTNRSITITATADTITSTVSVAVDGTDVEISGPDSLPVGQSLEYLVTVNDSGGNPISGASVALTSSLGNTISTTPVLTNLEGQGTFTLSADNAGSDTLTASVLGATDTHTVAMSGDAFTFFSPAPGDPLLEIPLNSTQTLTIDWRLAPTQPVVGRQVTFTSTRGTVTPIPPTGLTDSQGRVQVSIDSANAGLSLITATNADGASTQLEVEFVATVPSTMELQASPLNLGINEQSTITATVRDSAGNFVKNQTIEFSLIDISGGRLSVGQAVTDSAGQAETFYIANTGTTAVDGVRVDAVVRGTAVADSVNLTVAQRAQFLSIGTGNEIQEINEDAQYRVVYAVQVTDALGRGVAGEAVQVSILSDFYMKGFRVFPIGASSWSTTIIATCADEDINRNGILDPGEDFNASGQLEANNIATVSPTGGGSLISDQSGFVLVDVTYPQEFAFYVRVTLQATVAEVGGTEFAESTTFTLTGAASDFNSQNTSPPGPASPFGSMNATCADTL